MAAEKAGERKLFTGKCIIVGVTGGIAAYKSAELVRGLVKEGADVHVIMTAAAQEFITPLTLQTLSRNPVITDMFAPPSRWEVEHVALADRADLLVIAPATANIIGKIAAGIADDMLTTTVMAMTGPVLLAPAMNVHMYENPVVQRNLRLLQELGYHIVEPEEGPLACGYSGKGRMAPVEKIIARCREILTGGDLQGLSILITAGPTREYIDPVRFISNPSSGRMGYALAERAAQRGAEVILVTGPVALTPPAGVKVVRVESALEMQAAVEEHFPAVQAVIMAAAVGDYRPAVKEEKKMKKEKDEVVVRLVKNPDILAGLGEKKGDKVLVGFAAETHQLAEYARRKLREKKADLIVANDITSPGSGFGTLTNAVRLFYADGREEELPLMKKEDVAQVILDRVLELLKSRRVG